MTMISYAQDGEDVLLRRVFPDGSVGRYLDVGANDPVLGSVTKHFYDRGWRGVNVEPIPGLFDRLRADRPRDVNLNLGLSDREGLLTFYESPAIPGWSTFSAGLAASYRDRRIELREHAVPVTTLALVCEEHVGGPIDFLKVDVEGFERQVLAGNDWVRWRPRIVVIEDAWPESWEPLILGAGYLLARRTRMNRYYVRAEDEHLASLLWAPLGPDDDFVRHRHARMLASMTERFDSGEDFGPAALRISLWLRRQAARHPGLASACRKVMSRSR
jgi:FkbM family methyltransferase